MASQWIDGIFRDGRVEFAVIPPGLVDGTPVRVEFPYREADLAPTGPEDDREASRRRAFARMEKGIDLGGPPYPNRDEIHDRHGR